ncbi:MAG: 50S ribosomal protein L32 [Clostridiaceae bacterium]|nr:50S ribosomal protein L32 [Clostridiaceae bacterium]
MANPKRRWSKARTGKRRSQWKLSAPAFVECPQCRSLTIPHRVCGECGYYDKKQVIEKKVKKAKS